MSTGVPNLSNLKQAHPHSSASSSSGSPSGCSSFSASLKGRAKYAQGLLNEAIGRKSAAATDKAMGVSEMQAANANGSADQPMERR